MRLRRPSKQGQLAGLRRKYLSITLQIIPTVYIFSANTVRMYRRSQHFPLYSVTLQTESKRNRQSNNIYCMYRYNVSLQIDMDTVDIVDRYRQILSAVRISASRSHARCSIALSYCTLIISLFQALSYPIKSISMRSMSAHAFSGVHGRHRGQIN